MISLAFDESNLILYVNLHQVFRMWLIPFYAANVELTVVLHLIRVPATVYNTNSPKYFIKSQNDLYQVNEFVKFVSLFGGLSLLVILWQFAATGLCVLGTWAFWPISWVEQNVVGGNRERGLADVVKG